MSLLYFREYPCDHVAMLNVTLMNTGCPRIAIHETAVQLLHLLYKRFFLDDVVSVHDASFDKDQVRKLMVLFKTIGGGQRFLPDKSW